ncbi:DUF6884 domain-containing protein [Sediminibacillus halophilus]|uniref:DUF6884 domain-containing protein n=1 Tax=Sediminibacillus halophilus TaxID=482461 RepID=A0A1G9N4K7_9BACI|nr:DUF6884 domain-containing protein [Sediminibacillus halophilus]SDL80775.1 hypothetical protein SAMN05216244_0826 [Sediminibacillus halophilus]
MKSLCIIPCGKKKIWDKQADVGPVSAREAYIGTFHHLCETYADHFKLDWVVLSAKHGFLLPKDIVPENYDVTFNQKSNQIVTGDFLANQVKNKHLDVFPRIVVLTGRKYKPFISAAFSLPNPEIVYPLEGCKGIGHMQQRLKTAVANDTPIHSV